MKVIVGLGNPGKKYCRNRHNAGFMALDRFADLNKMKFRRSLLKKAYLSQKTMYGNAVLLVKPLTFMNNSGFSVLRCLGRRYVLDDLLVIYDDMDIELGRVKFTRSGSAGGHNGIASVIQVLRTESIPRLKIGISRPLKIDPVEYVLEDFKDDENGVIQEVFGRIETACSEWLRYGIEYVMQQYNQRK